MKYCYYLTTFTNRCACSNSSSSLKKFDNGTITAKSKLPVTKYLTGNLTARFAFGRLSVEQLLCTQTTKRK